MVTKCFAIAFVAVLLSMIVLQSNIVFRQREAQGLGSITNCAVCPDNPTMPFCLERAMMVVCSYQRTANASLQTCMRAPSQFFALQLQQSVVTKEEAAAKQLLEDHSITAIAIGSGKEGLCNVVQARTLCTDRPQLDLFEFVSWLKLFSGRQLPTVFHAEHVLEHFHPLQVQVIAASAFLMLQPGGVFRIAVPDGYKPSPSYQQYTRAGGTASGFGQNHMVSWTYDSLTSLFRDVGFTIVPREHFDMKGDFHSSNEAYENDELYGMIRRSFRNDERNKIKSKAEIVNEYGRLDPTDLGPQEPLYTSLWFDAVKPVDCLGGDKLLW